MKKIILLFWMFTTLAVSAQKKLPSVALHYSFTDFKTAMNIKANNLNYVLKNGQWSNLPAMDAGYGLSYWHGLTKNLDVAAGFNYTKSIYTFPVSTYSVTKKLLTVEATGVFKFLAEDKAAVTPYISAGAGLYSNTGKTGFYAPLGLGVHANLWNQAFVFAGASYRVAFNKADNKSFFYNIGVGTNLVRRKEKPQPPIVTPPVVVEQPKPITKDIAIYVKDSLTSLPLPGAAITLQTSSGKTYTGVTDDDGKLTLSAILKDDYAVSGVLNNIVTEGKTVTPFMFDDNKPIALILLHNDSRFTLSGKAVTQKGGSPVGDVIVSVNNTTQSTTQTVNTGVDGLFKAQLSQGADFTISGKKAGFISNIEQATTKGLNRSTTLYVKLELAIQEAKAGQQFVMNNIFFETNKAILNTAASTDLNRLVKYLQDNPSVRLEIQGHTDNKGNDVLNNRLSQNRASSVLNYLVTQGISGNRLTAKGFGSKNPIDTNATEQGRANNRRVEVKVLGE